MTSGLKSILGFAKQSAKGSVGTTFDYINFINSAMAPQNVVLPLDTEAGGNSPMIRSLVRTGVTSGGAVEFIPRPKSLGALLQGVLGKDVSAAVASKTGAYKHTITMDPADQWAIPYFTVNSAPGAMWADQLQDCRLSALALSWRAANFLRATVGVIGGTPATVAVPTATPDNGPQFLTVLSEIELPTATPLSVLSGSFTIGNAIPLDEQWIVGSYSPDNFDVVSRAVALQLVVKLTDDTLYKKVSYDPASGAAWTASMFKEAGFNIKFVSDKNIASTDEPYSLTIKGNSTTDNVIWTADPVGVRANRQVIMSLTGIFLADTNPVTVELVNDQATDY